MIISMTGFGKSETKFQRKKLNAEIRSLNSKNIDLNLRIPNRYREIESKIRAKINGELSRGKIDLLIGIDLQDEDKISSLNHTVIKKYINELKEISNSSESELLKMAIRLPESIKIEMAFHPSLCSIETSHISNSSSRSNTNGLRILSFCSFRFSSIFRTSYSLFVRHNNRF